MRPPLWKSGPESVVKELVDYVDTDVAVRFGRGGGGIHGTLRRVYADGIIIESRTGKEFLVPLSAVEMIETPDGEEQ